MKASYVIIAGILAGLALGGGLSFARFSHSPPLRLETSSIVASPPGSAPRVQIDHGYWDFGVVDRDTDVRHAFPVTNVGGSPLKLEDAGTTCTKCTIATLEKSEIAPGETVDVTIVYHTTYLQPTFKQTAFLRTNDPERPRIELRISGTVTSRFQVVPDGFQLDKMSGNESRSASVIVYGYLSDKIEVVAHEFTGKESVPYFELTSRALPEGELAEPRAKSGCKVVLTAKPGLPLGPIRQTIRLTLAMEGSADRPTVDVPVQGTVDSDISIVGANWDADNSRLAMGLVKASVGETRNLLLLVRGKHRHDVTFRVAKVEPEWLKVTLGDRSDLKSGAVSQTPLKIEVPKNAPLGSHRGNDQGKYAEILLDSTHPDVKQVRLYVQFVVVP